MSTYILFGHNVNYITYELMWKVHIVIGGIITHQKEECQMNTLTIIMRAIRYLHSHANISADMMDLEIIILIMFTCSLFG